MWWDLDICIWPCSKEATTALEGTKLSKREEEKKSHESFQGQCHGVYCFWYPEWVPSGQTANQHYYTEILTKVQE